MFEVPLEAHFIRESYSDNHHVKIHTGPCTMSTDPGTQKTRFENLNNLSMYKLI